MEKMQKEVSYDSSCERDLVKMWEDIKGSNTASLNRSLMKDIAKKNEKEEEQEIIEGQGNFLYAKEMWDSEKGDWVPFDMWGANYIINVRKEDVQLRMWQPLTIQPEYGPVLKSWQTIDSSYLNEQLREKSSTSNNVENPYTMSHKGQRSFYEMIKQDHREYEYEGRYQEIPGWRA
jgi:hypothetical protein